MEPEFFAIVEDVARSLSDDSLGQMHTKSHRYGTKVWFDSVEPLRTHFEAQVMGRQHIDGEQGVAVEIGWHGEERSEETNEQTMQALVAHEPKWRSALGPEAEAGEFFNASKWRRISEVWIDPDLSEQDSDVEIGARLADYINALQPVLNSLREGRA